MPDYNSEWELSNVTAIISAHAPCKQAGNSLVDILYGDVNPSGKLPIQSRSL